VPNGKARERGWRSGRRAARAAPPQARSSAGSGEKSAREVRARGEKTLLL